MELLCIEVPVDYTVAACSPAHPFHWALLRALTDFPASGRPGFPELAERLRFSEPAFLDRAWSELGSYGAVTSSDFALAEINHIGTEALRLGYFVNGRILSRQASLYFSRRGDRCVERKDFEVVGSTPIKEPPPWSKLLTIERIREALQFQMPDRMPRPEERILEFTVRWNDATEALARW
jgi:hypothetical protein